ncbi:Nascent polypeptide-associated complex subunit alpha protein [Rutstroemia sp. NJR-2017a WRK4]|nr:Nascent polypeptide-associated complex subunit alpha protein [Rutstroemia sp. NJR-2017a WRK4]
MSASDHAQQFARMENTSPRRTRSQSVSSDRPSMASYTSLLSPPTSVSPDPVYIAPSAASQIVTNDHDSRADAWLDQHGIEPSGETALVSAPALTLVNKFLDQLLFNFLSVSRSTSLATLRPAVSEVLKPKLAKDAISGADDELREYLGGGEDDGLLSSDNGVSGRNWDLELVWKRTRLRCMVYSSLGDMEEDDEDRYTAEGHLSTYLDVNGGEGDSGIVSPAVAIFLTSILEFMGEQVLVVAGQAAYSRLRAKHERDEKEGVTRLTDIADRVVVEESDMERVALDRTLGRLWRGWKKRVRTPGNSISAGRPFPVDLLATPPPPPKSLQRLASALAISEEKSRQASGSTTPNELQPAAGIPLPMSVNDIREIEIPGVALQSDDEASRAGSETDDLTTVQRPKSLVIFTNANNLPTPNSSQPPTPNFATLTPKSRKRANSLPPPDPASFTSLFSKRASVRVSTEVDSANVDSRVNGTITPEDSDVDAAETKNDGKSVTRSKSGASSARPFTPGHARNESTGMDSDEEEPQIMTSSRISINGRISPDDMKDLSSHSSLRSPSIHSLRLIDVTSAKSPTISRNGSIDAGDYISSGRAISISRPNSLHSPILTEIQSPRGTSPNLRTSTGSPLARSGSGLSSMVTNNARESISEVDEGEGADNDSPLSAVPADFAAAMQGVDMDPSPTSQNFIPNPVLKPTAPKAAPFVLAAPPTPQNYRGNHKEAAKQKQNATSALPVISNPKIRGNNARDVPNGLQPAMRTFSDPPPRSTSRPLNNPIIERGAVLPSLAENSSPETAKSAPRISPVQRNSPPRPVRDDSTLKAGPGSQSKPLRQSYGSTSSSSSVQKIKPIRTSEEGAPSAGELKSFDQLIQGSETIQYTLTPQTMRNIESPVSPAFAQNHRPATGRSHSSSVSKTTGLYSHPLNPTISRGTTSSRLRGNTPQPRDARADRDSLGDFSEFIRSTGPANSYSKEVPPRVSTSTSSNYSRPPTGNTHKGSNGTVRNVSVSGSVPRSSPVSSLPRRAESSAGRSRTRLQARDATVGKDSITDLIDFVRAGPEDKDTHRIPRTVAPFRSTMDSDQMAGLVGGKAVDATLPDARYSQSSIQASTQASTHQSSVNSREGLLNSSNKASRPTPGQSSMDFDDEDMMPKRKTRRVRDPYAIDFSDEEEDEYETTTSRPAPIKEEESLADFLRNVPPPPSPKMTSVFDDAPKPPKKKASFSSRFGRSGSISQSQPPKTSNSNRSIPIKHTPINPLLSGPSSSSNPPYGSHSASSRHPSISNNNIQQKAFQPREPQATGFKSKTSDLADFLMNSEPPVQMNPKPFVTEKEEHSTFASRMFGRRKKTSAGY